MAAQLQTRRRSQQQPRRYPQIVGNAFARMRHGLRNQLNWSKYRFYDSSSKRLVKALTKEKLLALCDGNKQFLLTHEDSTVTILKVVAEELNEELHLKITGYLTIMNIVDKYFSESFVLFFCPESSTSYFVQSVKFVFLKEVDLITTPHREQGVSKVVEIRQDKGHVAYIKQDTNGEEPIWSFEGMPLKTIKISWPSTVDRLKMKISSVVGETGEKVVFHWLKDSNRKKIVKLVSRDENSFCDIEIEEEEGKKTYVEVKSTNYTQKKSIILSKREWEEGALKQGNSYIIARPVLEASQVKLTLCKNPMKCHRIGFFLERKWKKQPE